MNRDELKVNAFETYYTTFYQKGRHDPELTLVEGLVNYCLQQPWFEMTEALEVINKVKKEK